MWTFLHCLFNLSFTDGKSVASCFLNDKFTQQALVEHLAAQGRRHLIGGEFAEPCIEESDEFSARYRLAIDESDTRVVINAMVELIGNPEDDRLRDVKLTTKTDEMGKYSFTNVPYGEYSFRVSAPGKVTYEIQIYIVSDALTSLHVKLK